MKLINNYKSIVSNVITAETLTLSQMSNIPMDLALEIMRGTAAGKGHMNQTYPNKVLKGEGRYKGLSKTDQETIVNDEKIKSEENQMLLFDNIPHQGNVQTDTRTRVVLNFNFKK